MKCEDLTPRQDRAKSGPLFVCAGEPSGDLYASLIFKKIKEGYPGLEIMGIGGDCMRDAGVNLVERYDRLMTYGLSAGPDELYRNYMMYRTIARALQRIQPHSFFAVSYPGINLLLCRYAQLLGCKVYYLLPPQIWAWGGFRKYFIKRWVDRVYSFFPFEYKYYRKQGIPTVYITNPLISHLAQYQRFDSQRRIGFMPGSRSQALQRHLVIMSDLMNWLSQDHPDIKLTLIMQDQQHIPEYIKSSLPYNLSLVTNKHHQAMKNCDLLVVTSGTASLEAYLMKIPQVFFYQVPHLEDRLLRPLLKITEYNLVNLTEDKKVVPSFVSSDVQYLRHCIKKEIDNLLPIDANSLSGYNRA